MFHRYRTLFARPGTAPMIFAGVLARMPLSMVGVGVIATIAQTHGSYTLAGAVAAVYALAAAVATPQVARLIDRYGQGRVVLPVALSSAAAITALVVTSVVGGPDLLLFVFALLAGITPSAPALVRSRWSHLLDDAQDVHTAYSWETVLDEVSFILGPPVAIGLSVAIFPQAGLLAAAISLLAGTIWLTRQRTTEPPVATSDPGDRGSSALRVLTHPTVAAVVAVMTAMGVIIGTVDVVSVAFAEHQGDTALASVVLSVYAAGSCLSGFVFGARTLTWPLGRLLRIGLVATGLTTVPLLFVSSIAGLSVAVFFAGAFFAPTMIMAAQLIERNTPAASLTEALTWSTAGLGLGTAIGPAVAGPIIDTYGADNGFSVAVTAGVVLLLLAAATRRALSQHSPAPIPENPYTPARRVHKVDRAPEVVNVGRGQ
ncbi:MFS transporter [Nocardia sp. FBN12]|uniref:MFS transporter n=1 Tax=Nocardia sp. FBN12 TaxID=3419766 RepID=UPI003D070263